MKPMLKTFTSTVWKGDLKTMKIFFDILLTVSCSGVITERNKFLFEGYLCFTLGFGDISSAIRRYPS